MAEARSSKSKSILQSSDVLPEARSSKTRSVWQSSDVLPEARSSKTRSIGKSSDVLLDIYCNLCYEVDGDVLEAEGFCQDCDSFLCAVCFASHRKVKQTRSHQLLDKYNMPQAKPEGIPQSFNTESCLHHQSENIHSYCKSCDQLCCKICLTLDHNGCIVEGLSAVAVNVKHSQELKDFHHKLDILKLKYNDNHDKANQHVGDIEKNYTEALNDMKKIEDEINRLKAETEKQAERIKADDLHKMETIVSTCDIFKVQIDDIKSNLHKKESNNVSESIFIAMKRAERQIKSFEDRLEKLNTENTIQTHNSEPFKKLQSLLNALDKMSFADEMLPAPLHVKDIDSQSSQIRCSIVLSNQQLLLTDCRDKLVKLMDMKQNKVVAKTQLPGFAWDIAKVTQEEFAVTCTYAQKVQFLKVTSKSISKIRKISVNGSCHGIAYNDRDQTLIVTYNDPDKVEILSLTGSVIRSIEKDEKGVQLFGSPLYVALSRDKTSMYVSDYNQNSVILMTLNGKVKTVYKDDGLKRPEGICVNKFGTVYVVGYESNTVHQIVLGSDKLDLLLSQNNGLKGPMAISYCDVEDNIFVGQNNSSILKVFKIK